METVMTFLRGKMDSGSYRTYEEWKPLSDEKEMSATKVLTVPMRNGNLATSHHFCSISIVLTVPMRNGNAFLVALLVLSRWVLTVPMRNGNFEAESSRGIWNSVLTVPMRNGNMYERIKNAQILNRFLPYLWGMETKDFLSGCDVSNCSYRTYEEWKPSSMNTIPSLNFFVLTVPMRNGNL